MFCVIFKLEFTRPCAIFSTFFFFLMGGRLEFVVERVLAKQEIRKKRYSLVREETSYSPILFAGSKVEIPVNFHHNFNADKVLMCQHFGPV